MGCEPAAACNQPVNGHNWDNIHSVMSSFLRLSIAIIVIATAFIEQVCSGNERPIIGIMCHEVSDKPPDCMIPASYVKAVETAGARVVPIFLWKDTEYYRKMVNSVNGVLYPGGNAKQTVPQGYFQSGSLVFSIARKLNYEGDHFPILGVCLGLQFLAAYSNNNDLNGTLNWSSGMFGKMLPLDFRPGFRNSSLYGGASDQLIEILSKQNVTPNYHDYGLDVNKKLRHPWRILSTNKDMKGWEFVSSMETDGPMAAVQFHPEKCPYEWTDLNRYNPSYKDALLASRHFYDWLVTESRKNDHRFGSKAEEEAALIYNYSPVYTGKQNYSMNEQIYFFT